MAEEQLVFNGIDGEAGNDLFQLQRPHTIFEAVRSQTRWPAPRDHSHIVPDRRVVEQNQGNSAPAKQHTLVKYDLPLVDEPPCLVVWINWPSPDIQSTKPIRPTRSAYDS